MINADRLRTAIAALRSGQYPQGKSRLRNAHGYCCLGVLTDVAIKHGGMDLAAQVHQDVRAKGWNSWYDLGSLSPVVQQWYGLTTPDPLLPIASGRLAQNTRASSCNDSLNLSFDQIADGFERLLLEDNS